MDCWLQREMHRPGSGQTNIYVASRLPIQESAYCELMLDKYKLNNAINVTCLVTATASLPGVCRRAIAGTPEMIICPEVKLPCTRNYFGMGETVTPPVIPNVGATAAEARDAFITGLSTRVCKGTAACVATYDVWTGKIVVSTNGEIPAVIAPELVGPAGRLGGVGVRTSCGNVVGRCAEFRGANELLLDGSRWNYIRFTDCLNPATLRVKPPCENCQAIFGLKPVRRLKP
jgi:filamentous hemagglutinin